MEIVNESQNERELLKNVLPETIVFLVSQISYVINCNYLWLNSYQCWTVMTRTLSYTAKSLVKMTWLFVTIHDYSWLVNFEFLIGFDFKSMKSLTKPKGHWQLYWPKEWRKIAMIAMAPWRWSIETSRNYIHITSIWQQGWISLLLRLNAVISKRLDRPNN